MDTQKICEYCHQSYAIPSKSGAARRKASRFCSNQCRVAYVQEHRTNPVRICASCGREHTKKTKLCTACYESRPHEYREYAGKVDIRYSKECLICHKIFYKPVSVSQKDWPQRKYCSRRCHGLALERPLITCPACGKDFAPLNASRERAKYCSIECRDEGFKKPLPFCELCGETCKSHGRRFCSPECKIAWNRHSNAYNYAGEDTIHLYSSSFWYQRAQAVRDRDMVCKHCGKAPEEGQSLNVHHIIPFNVSHDNSLDNLEALCKGCHAKADRNWRMSVMQNRQQRVKEQPG